MYVPGSRVFCEAKVNDLLERATVLVNAAFAIECRTRAMHAAKQKKIVSFLSPCVNGRVQERIRELQGRLDASTANKKTCAKRGQPGVCGAVTVGLWVVRKEGVTYVCSRTELGLPRLLGARPCASSRAVIPKLQMSALES